MTADINKLADELRLLVSKSIHSAPAAAAIVGMIEQLRAAALGAVPAGWRLAPDEPTKEMLNTWALRMPKAAFTDPAGQHQVLGWAAVDAIYRDMLAAAPPAPSAKEAGAKAPHAEQSINRLVEIAARAQQLLDAIDTQHDALPAPQKFGVPYGAVNNLREAFGLYALAAPPVDEAAERDDFLKGVCVALTCVTSMDCGVTWREIVTTAGVDELFNYAAFIEPDEWELAGFAKYAMQEFERGKPRKRLARAEGAQPNPEGRK